MKAEEMFRILKPLYSDRLARLEAHYFLSDDREKREIETELKLIYVGVVRKYKEPLLPPPPHALTENDFCIAKIIYNGLTPRLWGLSLEQLRRHILVAGATGSGKTNAVFALLKSLSASNIPWLVLDPLQAYRGLNIMARIYTVGKEPAPLRISLLHPPGNLSKKAWTAKVVDVLAQSLDLGEGAIQVLKDAILRDNAPEDATQRALGAHIGSRMRSWKETAGRALRLLNEGALADFFRANPSPEHLLKENVILEIDGLSETEKAIFSDLLILWIHNHRLAISRDKLYHVLIIEEAHHLLHSSGRIKERATERFLREARGAGEGIIVVDQQPSCLSPQVISQCGTRITFQLAERDDLSAATKYSLIPSDEAAIFGRLPIGHAIVKMNSGWFDPFLVKFDLQQETGGCLSDEEIASRSRAYSASSSDDSGCSLEQRNIPLLPQHHTDDVTRVLKDISEHPFSGVTERRIRLGWSGRKLSNAIREATAIGLLNKIAISTGSKPLTLFEPTDSGMVTMKELGLKLPSGGRLGGIVHRYWVNEIALGFEKLGSRVEREVVFGEKIVDVVVSNTGSTILMEVETG